MNLRTVASQITPIRVAHSALQRLGFSGSADYWERRYRRGGTSGAGSYGAEANFKASIINRLVETEGIRSVVEFGCGDGHQLSLARYPQYLGVDVSEAAIGQCRERFGGDPTKQFMLLSDYSSDRADLALSLDVIYHLVEDNVYEQHMSALFGSAERFVVIYSTNTDDNPPGTPPHIRHRRFTRWVDQNSPGFYLVERVTSDHSAAEFFVYRAS